MCEAVGEHIGHTKSLLGTELEVDLTARECTSTVLKKVAGAIVCRCIVAEQLLLAE